MAELLQRYGGWGLSALLISALIALFLIIMRTAAKNEARYEVWRTEQQTRHGEELKMLQAREREHMSMLLTLTERAYDLHGKVTVALEKVHTALRPTDGGAATAALLVVDDESYILESIRKLLREEPYPIFTATSVGEALEILDRVPIGVVISDYKMPGMDGVKFLAQVRQRFPNVQRIILTGLAEDAATRQFINESQVSYYITKPWDGPELIAVIAAALERYHAQAKK